MAGDGVTGMGGRACMLADNPDMLPAMQAVTARAAGYVVLRRGESYSGGGSWTEG